MAQASDDRRGASARRWTRLLAILGALALLAAACGGGDDEGDDGTDGESSTETNSDSDSDSDADGESDADADSGDGEGGGEGATGEPLKVMTVTTLNAAGPTYQNIANTAEAYAAYINARGGIAGRPLEVTVCDEQFDPAVATTCARQAVEEDMVAVVGSFTFFAESIVPVIAESDISWFGPCCPITPSELTSPHSFPIGNQPMYAVGAVKRAVDDGCTSMNAVIIDGAQIFIPPMENAIAALGQSFGEVIILPPTAQDYSAEVAQATAGDADCVITIISETPYITWNTAWTQSGTEAVQYGPQGNLNEISAAGNEESTDGDIIAGMYPDISTAPWEEYLVALDEGGYDLAEQDYNSLGGMGTWAAFVGFTQIAETIDGDITAASFFEAASNTDNLDLNGMVPPWTSPRSGRTGWRATSGCSTAAWCSLSWKTGRWSR